MLLTIGYYHNSVDTGTSFTNIMQNMPWRRRMPPPLFSWCCHCRPQQVGVLLPPTQTARRAAADKILSAQGSIYNSWSPNITTRPLISGCVMLSTTNCRSPTTLDHLIYACSKTFDCECLSVQRDPQDVRMSASVQGRTQSLHVTAQEPHKSTTPGKAV